MSRNGGSTQIVGRTVFMDALKAGLGVDEAKCIQKAAKDRVRRELLEDDPVRATINSLQRRLGLQAREVVRLRREREALIRSLADALNVDEPTALQIARLDVEEDEA